ncbi:hypothetical protein AAG570_009104 [Ranatra chinensis]|uniref:RING-CH-type domain-containing protein n=1 Tax=Ranatra chinensis TaxID=642074 RepID=A0ABD0ZE01_9HEMI
MPAGGRSPSRSRASTGSSADKEICRICHCEGDPDTAALIAPCYCAGSLRYVHQVCLQQWIKSSDIRCCELCKFQFVMHTKTKPFTEWEPLEMTGFERRKLLCAVMFHAIALTCVVWSLYVLIDRTADEIRRDELEWPFWTKLIVVAIGFTGGVVFMYIQCKAYMQICRRWKAFNRVIYVQNAPEKQPLPSPSPVGEADSSRLPSKVCPANQESTAHFKEETSIDLKGVRNLHIYFDDENRVCVQNDDEGPTSSAVVPPTSWHIKIGKAFVCCLSRCNELENGGVVPEVDDHTKCVKGYNEEGCSASKCNDTNNSNLGDSVLKLQIKKAEIVIKFGQKPAGESSVEDNASTENKDTSVNIKIDDKESEPIVIDLVKKTAVEPNDAVQIRFDFSENDQDRVCDSDESLSGVGTKLLDLAVQNDTFGHSETDSGSQSPLLSHCKNGVQNI